MTDYTPEPWAEYDNDLPKTLNAADYDRARACVNACAGIPTEQLGDVKALVEAANKAPQYIQICKQEEELAGRPNLAVMANTDLQALFAALAPFQKD